VESKNAKGAKKGVKKYRIRIPIPIKPEKPHSTKKGKKGYNRKNDKGRQEDVMEDEASFLIAKDRELRSE